MPNSKQTPVSGSHAKSEPTIRRTTIDITGAITTKSVPLSTLRRDAMDLSNNAPASLLLTREAAMRVTEGAITAAIANTWTNLVETERKKQSESSSKKQEENKIVPSPNKAKSDRSNPKIENKKVPDRIKSTTKASPSPPEAQALPKNSDKPQQSTPHRTPSMSASKKNSQQSVPKTKSSSVANDSKKKNPKSQKTSSATKNSVKGTSSEMRKKP